jgi:hypothetical protein
MRRGVLAALVCAAAMAMAGQASADLYISGDCCMPFLHLEHVEYSVEPTPEQWDFWTPNDPNAILSLQLPNEVFAAIRYADSPYWTTVADPKWIWEESGGPGHLSIRVRRNGPEDYYKCNDPSVTGICASQYAVWGNYVYLTINSTVDNPGLAWSDTYLNTPEPASWAMMLLGFFGMGAALRRRRAAELPSA